MSRGRNYRATTPLAKSDELTLRKVLRFLDWESGNVDFSVWRSVAPTSAARLPKREEDVTAFIAKRTKLFLDTWVRPYLTEMVNRERKKKVSR